MTDIYPEVRLELSGRITFQQDISVAQGAQVISILQGPPELTQAASSPERPALLPAGAPEAKEAPIEVPVRDESHPRQSVEGPRQALELSGARTNPEKMTAFASYLLQEEEHDTFTQSDVRRLFQRARERIPTHFTRDFDRAVQVGWIHEGEAKGEFYLSQAAQNVIENGFDSLRVRRGSKAASAGSASRGAAVRRKSRVVPVPDAFADIDHIPTTLDEVIPYHRVKLKRDKLLWAVKLAKVLGVEALQNTEAAWLTDKLGDAIPTRDMNGHFTGLRRQGFANRSMGDNAMRITETGEEYLGSLSA
ncbi:hypothetical protein [Streptomyces arenae]|uniref:hypothetical protein n=1 Tax=Streptomyces arenae TaxID=29301 RepID=UPI00265AE560|nr:hypothetical protein [Streptomyces arenae]MCG7210208.1 hypothetical protein [Streptomyces arenae]